MTGAELTLLITGMVLYAASLAAVYRSERVSILLLISGLLMHVASSGVRWYGIGHPPVFGTYEATLAGSWFLLLQTAVSYRSVGRHYRFLTYWTVPFAVALLLYGLTFDTARIPLTISERSLWVDFHALFSWLAFGPYAASAFLSAVFLWREKKGESVEAEPGQELLDDLIFRYINIGFINHTVMFALGSYYSSILFGNWWQWDLVNSTSLITWLSFSLSIHMRLFYGWKGERGAVLAIVSFMTAIVSYWGLIYFPPGSTYHVFDIGMKSH